MMTNYHTDQRPSYECSSRRDRLTTPTCRSVAAATVDAAVADTLLGALTAEQVALALSAADEVEGRHQQRQPGRRARGGTRPLRGRPGRTRLPPGRTGEPAGRPLPGGTVGSEDSPPWPRRKKALQAAARCAAAAAQPGRAGEARLRPARPLARRHHQRQGPQAAAAHPDRRRHHAARARPRQSTDRDPLAHRRHRRTHRRPARPSRHGQALPGRRCRARRPARAVHQQRRASHPAQRRRTPHRPRPAVRHRRGPVDPPRLQDPGTGIHTAPARSRWPRPPGGWAAAPGSSTTGSIPGSSTACRGQGNRFCIAWNAQTEASCRSRIERSAHLGRAAPAQAPRTGIPRRRRRDPQRHPGRLPAGLQHRGRLLLDRTGKLAARRAAGTPGHPLERARSRPTAGAGIEQSGLRLPAAAAPNPADRR